MKGIGRLWIAVCRCQQTVVHSFWFLDDLLCTFESMTNVKFEKVNLADITGWEGYRRYRPLIHAGFWLLYLFAYAFLYYILYESVKFPQALLQYSFTFWIDVAVAYFTVYYLIPRYLLQKRYKAFLGLFLLSAAFFILLQRTVYIYGLYGIMYPEHQSKLVFWRFNFVYIFFNIYAMPAIFAVVKLVEYWIVNQQRNQQLKEEKMDAELKFLKSQIHPHFLFNTLNNLYALTLDKSEKAPEIVLRLSDLLSYMLYDCNARAVPLRKEIQLLSDYIELEKIRYQDGVQINFTMEKDLPDIFVPPLLLIPFVENAFKHGMSRRISMPWLDIRLSFGNRKLIFEVNNNPSEQTSEKDSYTEGIGLKNVKRRLDLIYPEQYRLEIIATEKEFAVHLEIPLGIIDLKEEES